MARLYANENFPLPVVEHLRELGHDVLTTTEAGRHDQALPDDQHPDTQLSHRRTGGLARAKAGFRWSPGDELLRFAATESTKEPRTRAERPCGA